MRNVLRLFLLSLFVFGNSIYVTLAHDIPSFLVPKEDEDPLGLKPFFAKYSPNLYDMYHHIQLYKAKAEIGQLIEVKEKFDALEEDHKEWSILVSRLREENKGGPADLWPDQTPKQCMGALLFYPQELLRNPFQDDSHIYRYPSIVSCVALSALYKNPLAYLGLSKAYQAFEVRVHKINIEERRREKEGKSWNECKVERKAKEYCEQQSDLLAKQAHKIICQAQSYNEWARYYLANLQCSDPSWRSRTDDIKAIMVSFDLPEALVWLGRCAMREGFAMKREGKTQAQVMDCYHRALDYFMQAVQKGYYDGAVWALNLYKNHLAEVLPLSTFDTICHSGNGPSLMEGAEYYRQNDDWPRAFQFYKEAGAAGEVSAYLKIAEAVLTHPNIEKSKRVKRALMYYYKADRPGYALGCREAYSAFLYSGPRLEASPKEKEEKYKQIVDTAWRKDQLNDADGYRDLFNYWTYWDGRSIPADRRSTLVRELFSSGDMLEREKNRLRKEREYILNLTEEMVRGF